MTILFGTNIPVGWNVVTFLRESGLELERCYMLVSS